MPRVKTTLPTYSNNFDPDLTLDARGRLHVATAQADGEIATSVARLTASAATNNATLVKNAAGRVFHINGNNATAGVKYLKLFNKASAPNPAADTPFLTLSLPASAPFQFNFPGGLVFDTGIGYCLVTGAADLNNTAVAANDILGLNITYA